MLKNIQFSRNDSKVSNLFFPTHIFATTKVEKTKKHKKIKLKAYVQNLQIMNGLTKILLVAGAGVAVWYIPTLIALYNLDCTVISVLPTAMTGSRIDAVATMRLTNNSGTRIDIQSIIADILFNGVKIAQLNQTENLPIVGNAVQNFNIAFTIDAKVVGTEMIRQLMAQNLQNYILDVKGTIVANGKKLPFSTYWTLKDFKL